MAASLARQSALERPEWGHGAMTLALLEGLSGRRLYTGRAATHLPQEDDRDGRISLKELDFYISQRIQELVGERQSAVTNHTGNIDLEHIYIATVVANH